jgi:hypothetical protein
MNKGPATLQFQSLSVSPQNANVLRAGPRTTDVADERQPGEVGEHDDRRRRPVRLRRRDSRVPLPQLHRRVAGRELRQRRLEKWIWTGDPLGQAAEFYAPVISDPVVSKTLFAGTQTVFRTKTAGLGSRTIAEAQAICNEWTGTFTANAVTGPSSDRRG